LFTLKVNNAAWAVYDLALTMSPENVQRSFGVNVFGPLYLIQSVVASMPRGGRIINIGTVASKLGLGGMGTYAASKAAMDTLTFVLAKEVCALGASLFRNVKLTDYSSWGVMVKESRSIRFHQDLSSRILYLLFPRLRKLRTGWFPKPELRIEWAQLTI
jgi:NADP-dependent 3-hydroxy acid dehydrogenase YdfG